MPIQLSQPPSSNATATEDRANAEFDERLRLVESSIDKYETYIQNYLYSLTNQWQDAEDLSTQLWVFVLHKFPIEKITHAGMIRTKSYQLFIDHYRKQKRRPLTFTDQLPERPASNAPDTAISEADDAALKERFYAEYPADLTSGERDSLWLHARHGYTFKEISAQTGIPASTVGDWIKNARQKLADALNA